MDLRIEEVPLSTEVFSLHGYILECQAAQVASGAFSGSCLSFRTLYYRGQESFCKCLYIGFGSILVLGAGGELRNLCSLCSAGGHGTIRDTTIRDTTISDSTISDWTNRPQ